MAENASRFVIIDGVQIEKKRAVKLGLISEAGEPVKHKGKLSPQVAADEAPAPEAPADDDTDSDVAPADVPSVEEPRGRRARSSETARKG